MQSTDTAAAPGPASLPARPSFRLRAHNRKAPAPSLRMYPSDGNHYRCPWIEDSITVHSDGNVTCGLDDPHGQRSFGNVQAQSIDEIFRNPEYRNLQARLWEGHRCIDCTLYTRETSDFSGFPRARPDLPTTLVVEPTVKCNIRCLNDACRPNNDAAIRTRDTDMLSVDVFMFVIDQLADGLRHVYFFNYGDPFVHAQAEDMLLHLRARCPAATVVTSTNGIPLAKPGRAEKIVQAGVNTIVFTIGGVTQKSYERYHVRGKVDLALQGLRNVAAARDAAGRTDIQIVWRYLLFNWNDSLAEVDNAIGIAKDIGVDSFSLYLTHIPEGAASYRFAPGTPNFHRYRSVIDCALHYTRAAGLVQPDEDGLFPIEDVEGLGRARWTGYHARLTCPVINGWMVLAFASNCARARDRPIRVFVTTPWGEVKVLVAHMAWRRLALRVPRSGIGKTVPVTIVTPDHWFPAEVLGSGDTRCLGVLVREDERAPSLIAGLTFALGKHAGDIMTDDDRAVRAALCDSGKPVSALLDQTNGGRMAFARTER